MQPTAGQPGHRTYGALDAWSYSPPCPSCCRKLSNLDYKVTNDDIQELFETVGPLKKWGVNYDL